MSAESQLAEPDICRPQSKKNAARKAKIESRLNGLESKIDLAINALQQQIDSQGAALLHLDKSLGALCTGKATLRESNGQYDVIYALTVGKQLLKFEQRPVSQSPSSSLPPPLEAKQAVELITDGSK